MTNAEDWKAWEGRTVDGRFPLRKWLGGSDHSSVFLTELPGQSEKVAIKLIAAPAVEADRWLARWRAAAHLSHPHLLRIYEGGSAQVNGTRILYVVMELAEEDLSQILPQRALTPAEVTEMMRPMLDALAYLHGKGLVHGRIKPSNVQAAGDHLKFSSDHIRSSSDVNLGESNAGRRDVFDAPETAAGIVAPAGDLWSVGVTILAALTQKVPFAGDESQLDRGLQETVPQPFRGIVRECVHLDPQRRCSIDDIRARLLPPARSVPAPQTSSTPSAPARHFHYGWLIAVFVFLVFVVGLRIFYRGAASSDKNTRGDTPVAQPVPFTSEAPKPADTKGAVSHQVLPEVSASARNTITGTIKVVVRVEADAAGKVTSARLVSAGPSRYFAGKAENAAQKWEFSPPVVNGQPQASAWTLTFRIRRGGTQVSAERARR